VPAADKLLEATALDDNSCLAAADVLLKDATPLRDNGYKVTLARELVRRALRSLVS
jgi:CO/xanthine dehydrogenase FAD-binding subunit